MINVKSKAKSECDGNIYQFPRKPIEQIFAECAMRVRNLENTPEIEKKALIAICEGNIEEAYRLLEIAKKMKKIHMTVI
jgi:hypothetical protein